MADSSENVEKADGIVMVPNGEISQDSTNVSDPEATGQGQPPVKLPMWKFTLILVALCITVLCMALDNTILAPAIPAITNRFNSLDDIGWYGSAYLLTLSATPLLYGKLYAFYALKWIFLSAISLFELGSIICGIAPDSVTLIVGRAIAGIGAAGIFSGAILIIAALVPLQKRPIYTALIAAMYGIAGVVGPLIGGAFTDSKATWRWCFYVNLPLGCVAILFILLFLRLPPNHNDQGFTALLKAIDIPGTIAFIPAVISLLLVLQWGGTKYTWSSSRIIALLVVFGVLILIFLIIQILSGDKATVPPRVFKNRNIWGSCLFGFSLGAAFFVLIFYLATWFQAIKGVSAVKSAIMNLPLILSMTVVIITAGGLVSTLGYYVPFMIASAFFMSAGAGLLTTFKISTTHPAWIGYQVIFGIGVGCGMQQTPIVIQTVLPEKDIPIGTAMILFAQTFGGAISVGIAQNIFTNKLVKNLHAVLPDLDPTFILNVGATNLRKAVPPQALDQVLTAYSDALTTAFFVSVAASGLSLFGALVLEWRNVRRPQNGTEQSSDTADSDRTVVESTKHEQDEMKSTSKESLG